MAEEPSNSTPPTTNRSRFSSFTVKPKPDVYLYDWWLFRAEKDVQGKRLAVAGFTRRQKETQLFYSAPIVKKHDFLTLQTADGLTVVISGFINRTRSNENGIPSEVCDDFLIGFPFNWDHYRYHFGDIPYEKSSVCLSKDQVNIEVCGSNKDSPAKKLKDAPKDPTKEKQPSRQIAINMGIDTATVKDKNTLVSIDSNLVTEDEMECEPRGRDVEPHCLPAVNLIGLKEKENFTLPTDTVTENKYGVAGNVSSTAHGKTESIEASEGSFEVRRSSRLKSTKTGTNDRKDTEKKIFLHSEGPDLVTGDKVDCESGREYVADSSTGKCATILGSEANSVNPCEVIITTQMAIPHIRMESLSKKDMFQNSDGEHLTKCPSKAVTSRGKTDSTKKCLGLSEKENFTLPTDTVTENKFGVAGNVSSTAHGKTESIEAFEGSYELRRSSRLKSTKTGTNDRKDIEKKTFLHSEGSDLVTGDKVDCESGREYVADSSTEKRATLLGLEANSVNPCEVIRTTQMAIPHIHMESLSKINMFKNSDGEHLTKCPSKAVTSRGKTDSTKKCLGLSEPNKSSRLRNMKTQSHDRQDTEKDKVVTGLSGSDLVREDTVDCESAWKHVVDGSCIGPQAEINCLSDVSLVASNTDAVLRSHDGLIVSVEKEVSKNHLKILDSETNDVSPSEVDMNKLLVIPNSHLENLSKEDKLNSGAEHSKAVATCEKMDSAKRHLDISEVRKSSRLRNMKMSTKNNNFILGSLVSDLVTGEKVDGDSGGLCAADSSSIVPQEEMNCLSDVGLVVTKVTTALTSHDGGLDVLVGCSTDSVDTTQHEVPMHHSIIVDSEMNIVSSADFNLATQVVIPNNHLESSSGKDKCNNSAEEHLTKCPSKQVASCAKMNSTKRRLDLSETGKSSRSRNMKTGARSRQDTEKNKVILGSSGSDLVTGVDVDCESKGKYVAGSAQDKVAKDHSNILATKVNNFEPSEVNITTPLVIPNSHSESLSKNVKFESSGGKNFTKCRSKAVTSCGKMSCTKECLDLSEASKSSTQNTMDSRTNNRQETSRSSEKSVDATNHTNRPIVKNDSSDNKLRKSQSNMKRHLEFINEASTPISRNKKKMLSFLYPEESSGKRSKSGRLIVPPLDYWRNQQLLYDKSRTVAGVLNGLPVAESPTGSRSEPPRKKSKFTRDTC